MLRPATYRGGAERGQISSGWVEEASVSARKGTHGLRLPQEHCPKCDPGPVASASPQSLSGLHILLNQNDLGLGPGTCFNWPSGSF